MKKLISRWLLGRVREDSILRFYSFPRETWMAHGIFKTGQVERLSHGVSNNRYPHQRLGGVQG